VAEASTCLQREYRPQTRAGRQGTSLAFEGGIRGVAAVHIGAEEAAKSIRFAARPGKRAFTHLRSTLSIGQAGVGHLTVHRCASRSARLERRDLAIEPGVLGACGSASPRRIASCFLGICGSWW